MSHNLGRVVPDGRTVTQSAGLDLTPGAGPLGGPRFVFLHRNGTSPHADVKLVITAPTIALGQLVSDAGLQPPSASVDAVAGFHNTLQSIARLSGGTLPVQTSTITVPLFDDGSQPAEKLLDCLGLKDSDVRHVRVKSVCVEIDLEDPKCDKGPDCD